MTPCLPARVDCLSTAPAPHQPGSRGRAPAPEEHATIRETGRVPGPSQPVVQRPHEGPPTAQCGPRSSPSEHLLPARERAEPSGPRPCKAYSKTSGPLPYEATRRAPKHETAWSSSQDLYRATARGKSSSAHGRLRLFQKRPRSHSARLQASARRSTPQVGQPRLGRELRLPGVINPKGRPTASPAAHERTHGTGSLLFRLALVAPHCADLLGIYHPKFQPETTTAIVVV